MLLFENVLLSLPSKPQIEQWNFASHDSDSTVAVIVLHKDVFELELRPPAIVLRRFCWSLHSFLIRSAVMVSLSLLMASLSDGASSIDVDRSRFDIADGAHFESLKGWNLSPFRWFHETNCWSTEFDRICAQTILAMSQKADGGSTIPPTASFGF